MLERRQRSGTVEHVGTNLESYHHKDLPLIVDMFVRLRSEIYDKNPDSFFIALFCFFSYYEKILDKNNFTTFPLLGRLLFLSTSLLDETNQHDIEGKVSRLKGFDRDTKLFVSAEEMQRYLKSYKTAIRKKMNQGSRDKLPGYELLFEMLMICDDNSTEQKNLQEAIMAYFRNDAATLGLRKKECTEDQRTALSAMNKPAGQANGDVKNLVLDDVCSPHSHVIAGFHAYSQHKAPGANIPLYNKMLDEPDFPIVSGFLAELGRLVPYAMLSCIDFILEIFLHKSTTIEYISDKLVFSTFIGNVLNGFGPLLSNLAQRTAFKAYQEIFKLDPDKILDGDVETRRQYLMLVHIDVKNVLKKAKYTLPNTKDVRALLLTDISNAGDPAQHRRRQQIHVTLLAYFGLLRDTKNPASLNSSDFEMKVIACENPEDREHFKALAETTIAGLREKIIRREDEPAEVEAAKKAFDDAHPSSKPSTPLFLRHRTSSSDTKSATPTVERKKPTTTEGNAIGIRAMIASKLSRGSRGIEDVAEEKADLGKVKGAGRGK